MIPEGKFKGRKWRPHRQPYAAAIFDLMDSGRWRRRAFLGPIQSGKTLNCFVIPACHYLFEYREKLVCGVPTMDVAHKKWNDELLPVIQRTRYADLLPKHGGGSRGGSKLEEVRFTNGAVAAFLSGHGGDEKRSGFTARFLVVTEADKFDVASETSRETDPIGQLEGRTDSYDGEEEVNLECTVSIDEGRIWQEWLAGTMTRFIHECPHCGRWVSPEREDLVGWQDAETKVEARRKAHFRCPECRERITAAQRRTMVKGLRVLHRGQEVTAEGEIIGEPVETDTLSVRWSAFQNMFWSAGKIGAMEWAARRAADRDNAEKKMLQFVWALPHENPDIDLTPLDPDAIARRQTGWRRGIVPADAIGIGVGVDTHKRHLDWVATAILPDGRRAVIDYGEQPVPADKLGIKEGFQKGFQELSAYFAGGWHTVDGQRRLPDQVWVDSAWHEHTDPVYAFCRVANHGLPAGSERWRPTKGYGEGQEGQRGSSRYVPPKGTNKEVRYIGREFHLARSRRAGQPVVHINSDHWKSDLHQGLAMAADEPGAVLLFETASTIDHDGLISELTAEKPVEKLDNRGRPVIVWERIRRKNHKLDAGYASMAACELIAELYAARQEKQPEGWFAAQKRRKSKR